MKAVKIIIVAVVLAALGYGIWKMVTPEAPKPHRAWKDQIPPECTGFAEIVESSCDAEYGNLQEGDFDGLQTCYASQKSLFENDESSENCIDVISMVLNNIHLECFVEMSNKEQSRKEWPHREKMASLCDACMSTAGDSDPDLVRIKQGCTEYAALVNYNSRVQSQCGSRPSSLNSQWNLDNTKKLINGRPETHDPANHTKPYEDSEKSKVQDKLFVAHGQYLKAFVKNAETNVMETTNKKMWDDWSGGARRELDVFTANAKQVYGKSSSEVSDKAQEVKNDLFDLHVKYLTKYANRVKANAKNHSTWKTMSKTAREEVTAFVNSAKTNYGDKKGKEASNKEKEVKNILCVSNEAYLDSRIETDSLKTYKDPLPYSEACALYDKLSDVLYAEIESFEKNSWDYYGQSVSTKAQKLKDRVRALKPKETEQPIAEP